MAETVRRLLRDAALSQAWVDVSKQTGRGAVWSKASREVFYSTLHNTKWTFQFERVLHLLEREEWRK